MATQACTCVARCNACICGSLPPAKPEVAERHRLVPMRARVTETIVEVDENPLVAHAKLLSQFNNVWLRYGRGGSWDF